MSRSYKHTPIARDYSNAGRKWSKNQANRKVRKYKDLTNGKMYKKVYCTWDIHDYSCWWDEANIPWETWRKDKWIRRCLGK